MSQGLITLPATARAGEIIEIRVLIAHPMETGYRSDNAGRQLPRHIIEQVRCTYDGEEIFRARLHPAITANPYLAFHTRVTTSGTIECVWRDDRGAEHRASARLTVA